MGSGCFDSNFVSAVRAGGDGFPATGGASAVRALGARPREGFAPLPLPSDGSVFASEMTEATEMTGSLGATAGASFVALGERSLGSSGFGVSAVGARDACVSCVDGEVETTASVAAVAGGTIDPWSA